LKKGIAFHEHTSRENRGVRENVKCHTAEGRVSNQLSAPTLQKWIGRERPDEKEKGVEPREAKELKDRRHVALKKCDIVRKRKIKRTERANGEERTEKEQEENPKGIGKSRELEKEAYKTKARSLSQN